MTKAQIVQRLLESESINAEEAVILLQSESIPFHTITHPWTPTQDWYSTSTGNPDEDITKEPWAYSDTKFTPPSKN